VKSKKCIIKGCQKHPIYNVEGESKALYCNGHKKDGMVDVISKKCIVQGCQKHPIYNVEGESKALYCNGHKKDGMVDVKSKKCIIKGCQKHPCYNVEGESQALYCGGHKKDGMVNVKSNRCKNEWCHLLVKANSRNEGYCLNCCIHKFPDKKVFRNYKTKECAVAEYIKTEFSDVDWIIDKVVNGGCSKRRPDLLLDMGYQVIIVEVDEHQHKPYDTTCDIARINDLFTDVGDRPIILIRFNPDKYVKKDGTTVPSCWGIHKNGICALKNDKRTEWQHRLECLKNQIYYWVNKPENEHAKPIETVLMFYDE